VRSPLGRVNLCDIGLPRFMSIVVSPSSPVRTFQFHFLCTHWWTDANFELILTYNNDIISYCDPGSVLVMITMTYVIEDSQPKNFFCLMNSA